MWISRKYFTDILIHLSTFIIGIDSTLLITTRTKYRGFRLRPKNSRTTTGIIWITISARGETQILLSWRWFFKFDFISHPNLYFSIDWHLLIIFLDSQALKYWRFRMFLLPLNNVATRRILEGSSRCDIYTPPTNHEQAQLMDGFLRFIEGYLNKIRRPNTNKNWVTKTPWPSPRTTIK